MKATGHPRRLFLLSCLLFSLIIASCAPQRRPVPPGEIPPARPPTASEEKYGHQAISELTQKYALDYNHPRYQELLSVVKRLTETAGADKYPWHVYLLKDDSVLNASATKGNHIFVWTGLLDATKNESELATILSHEIGHVLAGHTDPDPSEAVNRILVNVGAIAAAVAVASATKDPSMADSLSNITQDVTQQVGNGILVYPYSRKLELEADMIGLFLMAKAGFNPSLAVDFWEKVSKDPRFAQGLTFFSSHPPAKKRQKRLRKYLPKAMEIYEKSPKGKNSESASGKSYTLPTDGKKPDSFDADATTTAASENTKHENRSPNRYWQVRSRSAVLYSQPNLRSIPLGEFSKGAEVEVKSDSGFWLEISRPDHGYIPKWKLERTDSDLP